MINRSFILFVLGTLAASMACAQTPGSLPVIVPTLTPKFGSVVGGSKLRVNVSFSSAAPGAGNTAITYTGIPTQTVPVSWTAGTKSIETYFQSPGVDSLTTVSATFTGVTAGGTAYSTGATSIQLTPAEVSLLGVDNTFLYPFQRTKGVVVLNGKAGPSGRTVKLTSSDPVIRVPDTVQVPAGEQRVEFDVTNNSLVVVAGFSTITAQIGSGPSATKAVSYGEFRQVSIVPSVTQIVGGNQLGFIVTTNGVLPQDTELGLDVSGTAGAYFPAPIKLLSGRKTVGFSAEPYGVDTPQTLTVTCRNSTAPFPAATVQILPASLVSVTLKPAWGGVTGTGTVTLDGEAGRSGAVIALESVAEHAVFPATVTVPYRSKRATFTYTTSGTDEDEVVNLVASKGSTRVTASATVFRAKAGDLVPSSTSSSGGTVTFTLHTNGSAGQTGIPFTLSSDDPAVVVPATVTVLPGKATATFTGRVTSTENPTYVTIRATGPSGVGSTSARITVN